MLATPALDVAIGLIFVYLLLSLVCSAIKEGLEAFMNQRASNLHAGILELLGDPNLVKQFYEHPLIDALYPGAYNPNPALGNNLPSYIPSRNFALALISLVIPGATARPAPPPPGGAVPSSWRDTILALPVAGLLTADL